MSVSFYIPTAQEGSNPVSTALEADALTTRPTRRFGGWVGGYLIEHFLVPLAIIAIIIFIIIIISLERTLVERTFLTTRQIIIKLSLISIDNLRLRHHPHGHQHHLQQREKYIAPGHSILTPGRSVPALTLKRQTPGRVATGLPI